MSQLIKNLLADQGYNIIALPKEGIQPLLLLSKEGDHLSSLESPMEAFFEADMAPLPSFNTATAPISGKKMLEFDLKTNFGFLSSLFQKFGLDDSQLKVRASAAHTYKVNFAFEQVKEDKVGLLDLDNFLTGAIPLEKDFRTYAERLRRSELYVVTAVLKSAAFSIDVTDETGHQLALDAMFQNVAGGKLSIDRNKNNGFTIAHHAGPELAFAFKAAQILYDKAAWFEFWKPKEARFRIKDQQGLVLRGEEDFPIQLLPTGDELVVL